MVGRFSKLHLALKSAIFFLCVGVLLLGGAFASAYFLGPSVPQIGADGKPVLRGGKPIMVAIDDIGPESCAGRLGHVQDPGGEAFRLIDVQPQEVEIGRHLCLIVAGVVPSMVVDSAQREVDEKQANLTKARQDLDAAATATPQASASKLDELRKKVENAETALETALTTQRPAESLTLYLDNSKVPIPILARSTNVVQPLYVELSAPDSATDEDAKFWRELVRGVARNDGSFGEVEVAVGLSRKSGAADFPETGAGAEHAVTLHVFSGWTIVFGLGSLASLAVAFGFYAYGAPILRDNSLTRAMLPSELEAAKLGLDDAIAKDAKAKKDLADAKAAGGPVDSTIIAAAVAAGAAVNQARNRVGRVIGAFGQSPEKHRKAQEDVARATAASEAAIAAGASASAVLAAEITREQTAGQMRALIPLDEANKTLADIEAAGTGGQALVDAQAAKNAAENVEKAMGVLVHQTIASEEARGEVVAAGTNQTRRAEANTKLVGAERARTTAEADVARLALVAKIDATALRDAMQSFAAKAKDAQEAKIAYRPVSEAIDALNALKAIEAPPSMLDGKAIGSFSLGRTQMAFWLFLVVAAYIFIAMSVSQIYGVFTDPVVYLLGISGLTTAGAALLSSGSSENRVSRNFVTDILSADGAVQLQRLQAVIFTLVLGGVFFYVVASSFSMPKYDPMQLVLMGLVNGLYVGLKTQDPT